jgi:hypothetical protein
MQQYGFLTTSEFFP